MTTKPHKPAGSVRRCLAKLNACHEARKWSGQFGGDWRKAWYACPSFEWLEWLTAQAECAVPNDSDYFGIVQSVYGHYSSTLQTYWHKPSADAYRKLVKWRDVRNGLRRIGIIA